MWQTGLHSSKSLYWSCTLGTTGTSTGKPASVAHRCSVSAAGFRAAPMPCIRRGVCTSRTHSRTSNPMKMQRNTDPAGNSIGIEPTVRVEDVYKSFQDKKKSLFSWRFEAVTVPALRGVSLDVYAGEVFGLLGPNSSGKTTLLRCMSTLCKPDRGAVYVLGKHTVRESFAVRHCIGVVFQDAGVDKILTGREHMELFGNLYHMPPAHLRRRIDELVGMLELEPYVDRLTGTYSGGIKRRLDLALGLLHEPSVLLLDEPTVGLDLSSRRVIWNAVRKYATAGNTIVFTSHYLEEVEILADRVAILDEGVSIAVGSPPDLKRQIGGRRFTIRVEEFCPENIAQAALEALRSEGIVERAQINAFDYNALELFVEPELLDQLGIDPSLNEDEAYSVYAERIRQTLKGKGFDLFGITERGVSLSDVYMSFAGRDFRAADEAARLDASTKKRKPKRRSSLES